MLLLAFAKDVTAADPERKGIVLPLLSYYYQHFFHKTLDCKQLAGQPTHAALVAYFSDIITVGADQVLSTPLGPEAPFTALVRATEAARRERVTRIAAGDEGAQLNFPKAPVNPPSTPRDAKGAKGRDSAKGQPKGTGKGPPMGIRPTPPRPSGKGMGKGPPATLAPRPSPRPGSSAGAQRAVITPLPRQPVGGYPSRASYAQPYHAQFPAHGARAPGPAGQKRPYQPTSSYAPLPQSQQGYSYGGDPKRSRVVSQYPNMQHPRLPYGGGRR